MSSISSTYLFLFGFHVNVYRLGGLRRKKGTKRRALPCTHAQILRTIFFLMQLQLAMRNTSFKVTSKKQEMDDFFFFFFYLG